MARPRLLRLAPDISDELRMFVSEFYDETGLSDAELSKLIGRGAHWIRNVLYRRGDRKHGEPAAGRIVVRDALAILHTVAEVLTAQDASSEDLFAALLFYVNHCQLQLYPGDERWVYPFAILRKDVEKLSKSLCDFLREQGVDVSPRLVARYFGDEERREFAAIALVSDLAGNADDFVAKQMLEAYRVAYACQHRR